MIKITNKNILYIFTISILSGIAIFFYNILIFFLLVNLLSGFFSDEGFFYSSDYFVKAFKAGLITGPIIGVGTWYLSYKKNKKLF
ncbi:hypothetical protein AYY16_11460 [Morganella psychrotolerans]|nr:hypothetical protein AYY16_11460 [Morganella psychrotolerans]